ANRRQPWSPAGLQRPEKRHAIEEAKQQRRADRQKRAGNIAYYKNEKCDVHGRDSASIHRDPRADEQQRRPDRSDQAPEHGAGKKEKRVSERTTRRFRRQMDPSSDNEERTNN